MEGSTGCCLLVTVSLSAECPHSAWEASGDVTALQNFMTWGVRGKEAGGEHRTWTVTLGFCFSNFVGKFTNKNSPLAGFC